MVVASPAVRSGGAQDLQVALLDVDPDEGTATLRLTVTPLLSWLWLAAGIMVIGGIVAGFPRTPRLRSGTRHARQPAGVAVFTAGTPEPAGRLRSAEAP